MYRNNMAREINSFKRIPLILLNLAQTILILFLTESPMLTQLSANKNATYVNIKIQIIEIQGLGNLYRPPLNSSWCSLTFLSKKWRSSC